MQECFGLPEIPVGLVGITEIDCVPRFTYEYVGARVLPYKLFAEPLLLPGPR